MTLERFRIAPHRRLLRAALLAAYPALAGPATAQDAPAAGRTAIMQACRGDYLNFCRGVAPGGGGIARHAAINGDLGQAGDYTAAVDRFLASAGLP